MTITPGQDSRLTDILEAVLAIKEILDAGVEAAVAAERERRIGDRPEVMRCTICGFVVDTRYEAEKPTINFSTAGRSKSADSALAQAGTAREARLEAALRSLIQNAPESRYDVGSLSAEAWDYKNALASARAALVGGKEQT